MISRAESKAYMDGWMTAYHYQPKITNCTGPIFEAWMKGYEDCKAGTIDADWALGPDKVQPKDR